MAGELVVGGGQPLPGRAELGLGHRRLAVLDAYAHGEGLGGHGHPRVQQHLKGVPGRVAGGQHQCVAGQVIGTLGSLRPDGGEDAVTHIQPGELMAETYVAPQAEKLLPDMFYHRTEHVGADVGLVLVLDVLRRARGGQGLQYRGDAGVMDAGGQLAVGEGARASLAELDVGGGIEGTGAPKALHIPRPLLHRPAPLQYDGGDSVPGQVERGEEPRRAHSHHHRRQPGVPPHRGKDVGPGLSQGHAAALGAAHQGGLIVRRHVHRTDIVHVVLLPRVDGLPHQGELPDGVRGDPENPRGAFFQLFHPAADREGDILNPYHFDHLGNSVPRLSGMHNGNCGEQGGSRGN